MFDVHRNASRAALKLMTTAQLERGLEAPFPPSPWRERAEVGACFVGYAYSHKSARDGGGSFNQAYIEHTMPDRQRSPDEAIGGVALSMSYEYDAEWLHGEVLRELAERGATVEPPAPVRSGTVLRAVVVALLLLVVL